MFVEIQRRKGPAILLGPERDRPLHPHEQIIFLLHVRPLRCPRRNIQRIGTLLADRDITIVTKFIIFVMIVWVLGELAAETEFGIDFVVFQQVILSTVGLLGCIPFCLLIVLVERRLLVGVFFQRPSGYVESLLDFVDMLHSTAGNPADVRPLIRI